MTQTGKTFRVFVSSTFSDLKEERNALQRYVFPRLTDLARIHGCRFQAIDLRWGISEEAGLDQRTMQICLNELARCQKTTPRPNFIVLLGDRYGWEPLPEEIPESEFDEIKKVIAADKVTLTPTGKQRPERTCLAGEMVQARLECGAAGLRSSATNRAIRGLCYLGARGRAAPPAHFSGSCKRFKFWR